MEIRLYVEEYGTLVIQPQHNSPEYISIAIVDDDADATERELLVLNSKELDEFVRALTYLRITSVAGTLSN